MPHKQLRYVGKSIARVDGVEKVTGKAKFTVDMVILGMLQGKILRSPYAHAHIKSIDAARAEALTGVAADHRDGQ
jgi:CO/xanthine dehydrogenase Mo-binding subunit